MKNYWICSKYHFATWEMEFLPIEDSIQVERLMEFTLTFLQFAEQEMIFSISDTHTPAKVMPATAYIELLQQQVATHKKFSFLSHPLSTCLDGIGTISYYDKSGSIASVETNNVGQLMRHLSSDNVVFARNVAPVQICGLQNIPYEDTRISRKVIGNISLYTNIWFPKVINHFEEHHESEVMDNRQLAALHTPRLNRFLERVRALTITYGGNWWVTPGEHPQLYSSILTETGIRLDMDNKG